MLNDEIHDLHHRIDEANRQGQEEQSVHLERMLSAKSGLLAEQMDILDRFYSMGAELQV
jgi:hypothetical protein